MLVKKKGKEFKAKVDIVCPRCGAALTIDASDIKLGSKCSGCFTYKCGWCKRHSVAKSDEILTPELIAEYEHIVK